jgi:hypothetical protein
MTGVHVECSARVLLPDAEHAVGEPIGAFGQIHQQIASLLYSPRPIWVGGDAEVAISKGPCPIP